MADEAVKDSEEGQDEQASGPGKAFPIRIAVMALVAVLIAGGSIFAWKSGLLSGLSSLGRGQESISDGSDIGPIYPLSTFIVNLVGDRGKSYLKAQVDLELSNIKVKVEIDKRLPQFRDSILTLLSSKSQDDIKSLEGKYQLREEIISSLNQLLITGRVLNVYFTDFIVQ